MKLNDHLLRIWTHVMGLGLPLLVMLAGVLGWSVAVQFGLATFMVVVAFGTQLVVNRFHRRH